jgi:AcrR family transcriptional regulator
MVNSLKEKTNRLRRDDILNAAVDVFAKRGFRGATVKDVASAAGVADGTIYNVFENKGALLNALLERLRPEPPSPHSQEPLPQDTGDLLRFLFEARLAPLESASLDTLRVVLSEALVDPDLRAEFLARVIMPVIEPLETLMQQHPAFKMKVENKAGVASRLLVCVFLGAALLRLLDEPRIKSDARETLRGFADLLAHGLK